MKKQSADKYFIELLDSYTEALSDNSDLISQMIIELSKRELSESEKKEVGKLTKELDSIDRRLNKIK